MTVLNIARKELNTVADNDIDKIGNKIKLKSTSLSNTQNNIMNIPIISSEKVVEKTEKIDKPNSSYVLNAQIFNFESIREGNSKPINVKPKMLDGMRKHRLEEFGIEKIQTVEEPKVDELSFEENQSDVSQQKEINNITEPEIDLISESNISIEQQDNQILNEQVEQVSTTKEVTESDINKKFNEISDIRKQVESMREEASKALQAANKSDEDLRQLTSEHDRIVTELKNAKIKILEMDSKLMETIKKQSDILSENRIKFEKTLFESNNRKEANESEINLLKTKNAEVNSRLLEYQNLIKAKQQIIDAMQEFGNDNSQYTEEEVKKVA